MSHQTDINEWMVDDRLVQALLDGDEAAGAFLVSRHAPRLLGYAAVDAPDISETDRELIAERSVDRAVQKIEAFDHAKGTFPGWLRGILRNELREWRRTHPPSSELTETTQGSYAEIDAAQSKSLDAETMLARLLAHLSESDQLMIKMRNLEDLPYAFIAETLGVREEACRQRHKRALDRLRAVGGSELDEFMEEEVS